MTAAERKRRQRARRFAERVLVDGRLVYPGGTHGSSSTYTNNGCRCVECTAAHARKVDARRLARWAARELDADGYLIATGPVTHGRSTTYHNWGCQCRPCLDAAAEDSRRRRTRAVAS